MAANAGARWYARAPFAASDLSQSAYCAASNGDVCTPMFTAVGLKYADGSALSTQSMYTLEQPGSE
jgi:hypothetical protein